MVLNAPSRNLTRLKPGMDACQRLTKPLKPLSFPENNEYLVAARAMVRYQKGEYRELFSILEENSVSFCYFLCSLLYVIYSYSSGTTYMNI